MTDRGSALIEVLAIGFLAVLLVGQSIVAVGRLAMAGGIAEEVAHLAAVIAADTGDLERAERAASDVAPGAEVVAAEADGTVTVFVRVEVAVLGPSWSPVTMTVGGEASVRPSPYRSGE